MLFLEREGVKADEQPTLREAEDICHALNLPFSYPFKSPEEIERLTNPPTTAQRMVEELDSLSPAELEQQQQDKYARAVAAGEMTEEEAAHARRIRDWTRRPAPDPFKAPLRRRPLTDAEEQEAWHKRFLANWGTPALTPEDEEKATKRAEALHKALLDSLTRFKRQHGVPMTDNNVVAIQQKRDDDAKLMEQSDGDAAQAAARDSADTFWHSGVAHTREQARQKGLIK